MPKKMEIVPCIFCGRMIRQTKRYKTKAGQVHVFCWKQRPPYDRALLIKHLLEQQQRGE